MTTSSPSPDTLWAADTKRIENDAAYAAALERFVRSRIPGADYSRAAVFLATDGPRLVAPSIFTLDGTDFQRDHNGRPASRPQSVRLDNLEDLP